jgi:hypothetical protein
VNAINPAGEMVCDQCEQAWPCHLRGFHMGSRACQCGGRYYWYAADKDDDADEWERW